MSSVVHVDHKNSHSGYEFEISQVIFEAVSGAIKN